MKNLNLNKEEVEMLYNSLCVTIHALEDELDEIQTRHKEFTAKYGCEDSSLVSRIYNLKDGIKTHEALLNKVFALKSGRQ